MTVNLGTIKAVITADTSDFDKGVSGAMGGLGSLAKGAGKAVAAVGAVGAAVTAASVKLAGDFESSLTSAGAKAGATAAQMQDMKAAALDASGASEFSAKQAADAMGFLAQAGFEVNEQVSALPGVLNLASAGELELASAADITSNVLSGFALRVEEVGRVNDVLVKAANSANTSVTQLGNAMSYAAPTATGAGVSLEETAAVIGKLSDAGIQGSRAGRGFNQILVQLSDVAGGLGTSLSSAEIKSLGFSGSLAKLESAGLTAGNAVEHFGREAGPAIQALLNQGIGSIRELDSALMQAAGTAQEVAAKKIDTLNGAVNVLQGNVHNLMITFGEAFLPILKGVAVELGKTADAARKQPEMFNDIRDAVIDGTDTFADFIRAGGMVGNAFITLGGILADGARPIRVMIKAYEQLGHTANAAIELLMGNTDQAVRSLEKGGEAALESIEIMTNYGDSTAAASKAGDEFSASANTMASRLNSIAAEARGAVADMDAFTAEEIRMTFELNKVANEALDAGLAVSFFSKQMTPERLADNVFELQKLREELGLIDKAASKPPPKPQPRATSPSQPRTPEDPADFGGFLGGFGTSEVAAEVGREKAMEHRIEKAKELGGLLVSPFSAMGDRAVEAGEAIDSAMGDVDKSAKDVGLSTQQIVSGVAGLATQLGSAVGLSQELQGALGGVANIATSLASGNIFGAISGGISLVASLVGGGDERRVGRSRNRQDPEKFADLMAEKFAEKMQERDEGRVVIQNLDARGALANRAGARRMRDLLEDEVGLSGGVGGGG